MTGTPVHQNTIGFCTGHARDECTVSYPTNDQLLVNACVIHPPSLAELSSKHIFSQMDLKEKCLYQFISVPRTQQQSKIVQIRTCCGGSSMMGSA